MSEQRARMIAGSVISLGLLGWLFWQTDWGELARRSREADPLLIAGSVGAVAAGIVLRAWRWRMMLEADGQAHPLSPLFDSVSIGYLANNLLPARLGDLLRAYLAARWDPVTLPFALSTTIVERVIDTLVVVLLLFGMLPFLPVPPLAARAGILLGALFSAAALALGLAAWQRERVGRIVAWILTPLPVDETRWSARLVELLAGFDLLRDPARLARVLGSSALIWSVAILSYWFVFRAFGLDLSIAGGAFTISMAAIGMALPSGPAAAGTFDAAASGALTLLGVELSLAGGIALILHAINFLTVSALGLWSLARRGLSLGTLAAEAEAVRG